jgi:hypothetical protein
MRPCLGFVVVAMLACGKKPNDGASKDGSAATAGSSAPQAAASPDAQLADAQSTAPSDPTLAVRRPEWLTSDTPGATSCPDRTGRLDCQAGSPLTADRDSAKQAAIGLALDAMAIQIAREAAAQKAGRPWTPNDQTVVPDEAKDAARKAIDAALKIGPSSPPIPDDWYWEEYAKQSGSGTEIVGFVRMSLRADARKAISAKLAAAK